jgi:predicted HicB family RNase H-like nuclease
MGKKKQANNSKERMVHIRLNPDTHRLLRVRTAEEDVSIQDWVTSLIERELKGRAGKKEGRQ